MHYPKLEAVMDAHHVTLEQVARCASVDEATVRAWTRDGTVQFPVQAAFAVQSALFPDYSVEELFGAEGA